MAIEQSQKPTYCKCPDCGRVPAKTGLEPGDVPVMISIYCDVCGNRLGYAFDMKVWLGAAGDAHT